MGCRNISQSLGSGTLFSHLFFWKNNTLCGQEDSKDTPASFPVCVFRGHSVWNIFLMKYYQLNSIKEGSWRLYLQMAHRITLKVVAVFSHPKLSQVLLNKNS